MTISTLILALATSTLVNALPQQLSQPSTDPTCSEKEQGSTFSYATSAGTYDVVCGQDYYGGDLRYTQTESFKDCLAACDTETSCVTVAYTNNNCYLKNELTSGVSNANVWSAKKQTVANVNPSCVDKADNGKVYQASKGQYKIICGQEYAGGDLTSTNTESFEGCIEACASNTQCIDVS